jgi:hypothetical protein
VESSRVRGTSLSERALFLFTKADKRTYDVRLGSDAPALIAPLGQALDDIGLVAHQSEQAHDLFAARADPPKHVALLSILEDQDELIYGDSAVRAVSQRMPA